MLGAKLNFVGGTADGVVRSAGAPRLRSVTDWARERKKKEEEEEEEEEQEEEEEEEEKKEAW